ncbi:MAG: YCF48-related protein [Planctomycetales bacterium]
MPRPTPVPCGLVHRLWRFPLRGLLVTGLAVALMGWNTQSPANAAPPRRGAQERPVSASAPAVPRLLATPLQDDAHLRGISFVSPDLGWAVGDHGVICHTRDGGKTWELQPSGVECALHSVCFLTDRIGWASGGETAPHTQLSQGVLLTTRDGGHTWTQLVGKDLAQASARRPAATDPSDSARSPTRRDQTAGAEEIERNLLPFLPRLTRVEFFSPDEGIVVGQGTAEQPGGVFLTEDGGKSWSDRIGQLSPGWLAADFLNPETGVVVGPRGRMALVNGDRLGTPRMTDLGRRALRDVTLQGPQSGWLVGDGGLVLCSRNAGLVWQAPPTALPDGIRDACDFQAVACRGERVWIAGHPGAVVWHSPDGGKTWRKQRTGQTVPLSALHFSTDRQGVAVGALGTVLRTEDAGETWSAVRGDSRRAALWHLSGQLPERAFDAIVQQSGEAGFRSVLSVIASEPERTEVPERTAAAVRLHEAMLRAGGSAGELDWRLPLAIPGLERNPELLLAEWNRLTEGRLEETLIGGIVRSIRTWRPSVLVLEKPAENDALGELIYRAAMKGVDQCNDSTRFLEQLELAGLEPWPVERVFVHLPPGSVGHVQIEPYQYLPRLQQTVRVAAAAAEGVLYEHPSASMTRATYRLVRSRWDEKVEPTLPAGFFTGLSIPPGSAARRDLAALDDQQLEARQARARRQRDFAASTERSLSNPRKAAQIIAQLAENSRGLSDEEGARQLADLAERYRAQGHWQLAELTLQELVERYPQQPEARQAMQTLVQLWGSAEVTWRRLRLSSTQQRRERNDPSPLGSVIQQVEARLSEQLRAFEETGFDLFAPTGADVPIDRPQSASVAEHATIRKDLLEKIRFWQSQAIRMGRELERQDPQVARQPSVQFPLAASYRQLGAFHRSDEIYRRMMSRETKSSWSRPAELEFWLLQPLAPPEGAFAECVQAPQRPQLDGILSDPCWQNATEMILAGDRGDEEVNARGLAMLCHDREYLYVAVSLPKDRRLPRDLPSAADRQYDDDLSDFDRVTLCLDVDRDRVSYFSFSVDQRGCTSEACWMDRTWNPKWLVAVDADDSHWRLEVAIPFEELGPAPPESGTAWGVGIIRTMPAVGQQSWTQPTSLTVSPETFGLIRFD